MHHTCRYAYRYAVCWFGCRLPFLYVAAFALPHAAWFRFTLRTTHCCGCYALFGSRFWIISLLPTHGYRLPVLLDALPPLTLPYMTYTGCGCPPMVLPFHYVTLRSDSLRLRTLHHTLVRLFYTAVTLPLYRRFGSCGSFTFWITHTTARYRLGYRARLHRAVVTRSWLRSLPVTVPLVYYAHVYRRYCVYWFATVYGCTASPALRCRCGYGSAVGYTWLLRYTCRDHGCRGWITPYRTTAVPHIRTLPGLRLPYCRTPFTFTVACGYCTDFPLYTCGCYRFTHTRLHGWLDACTYVCVLQLVPVPCRMLHIHYHHCTRFPCHTAVMPTTARYRTLYLPALYAPCLPRFVPSTGSCYHAPLLRVLPFLHGFTHRATACSSTPSCLRFAVLPVTVTLHTFILRLLLVTAFRTLLLHMVIYIPAVATATVGYRLHVHTFTHRTQFFTGVCGSLPVHGILRLPSFTFTVACPAFTGYICYILHYLPRLPPHVHYVVLAGLRSGAVGSTVTHVYTVWLLRSGYVGFCTCAVTRYVLVGSPFIRLR